MKGKIELHKWFPFLNSWKLSDEPKMVRMVKKRMKEIKRAESMAKGLPKPRPKDFGCWEC